MTNPDIVIPIAFFLLVGGIIAFGFWKQGSKKERIKKKAEFRKKIISASPKFGELATKSRKDPRDIFGRISNLWKVFRSSTKNSSERIEPNEFTEKDAHEKGFSDHYAMRLKPLIEDYETSRRETITKANNTLKIRFPLLCVVSGGILLFALFFPKIFLAFYPIPIFGDFPVWLFFSAIALPGTFAWVSLGVNKPLAEYKGLRKETVLREILSFTNFEYSERASIEGRMHEFLDFDIVPNYDFEHSEDNLSGSYKNITIDLFETHLQNETHDDKGRPRYKDVFKGMVCLFDVPKSFSGKTIVKKDKGALGNWFSKKINDLENVRLEDPRFEKTFEVFSSDQIEARTLLTPSFMERLLELKEILKGKTIECSFYKSSLLIMIPIKHDLFELGSVFEPVDFAENSRTLLKELSIVFTIVDSLQLDLDIGI